MNETVVEYWNSYHNAVQVLLPLSIILSEGLKSRNPRRKETIANSNNDTTSNAETQPDSK